MPANYPTPQTFTYKVDQGGCAIDCDVYIPESGEKGPFPVIIWMHYSGLVFENRHVVGTHMFHSGPKRGYVVVNIDYRLAPQAKIGDIYQDVEDCALWVREKLPMEVGEGIIDTERLIIGGGSCGAQLALTAGLYLQPPPKAVVSLYALVDPTDPAFTQATKPNPPPGRENLIQWDEVEPYLGENVPMVSHPEISADIRALEYRGRGAAYFYMLQEGTYVKSVYGDLTLDEIKAKWAIPPNVTEGFPPTFVAHAQNDRYVPHTESEKLVEALKKAGIRHHWWSVPGNHDHGFDTVDMEAGEEGEFDKEFASHLWPWLDSVVKV